MELNLEQGKELIKLARKSINSKFSNQEIKFDDNSEKKGVFVTLHTYPDNELRGCIGFIEPVYKLKEAISKAAILSAFSDPRFYPLRKEEIDKIIIEISVLTKPALIKNDYLKNIKIGEDGLIIEHKDYSGLLLPQVFTEHKCNAKKALEMTCNKAGLDTSAWKEKDCKVYKFQVQIFKEKEPNGEIIKV